MYDPSSTSSRKETVMDLQTRKMVLRVLEKCIEEQKALKFSYSIGKSLDRAVYYSGVSKRTLMQIQKEANEGRIRSPSRKGKTCEKYTNIQLDDFDRSVIHDCIQDFYLKKKVAPTGPQIFAAIKEKIEFPWGIKSLRKMLRQMGYEWQRSEKNRPILLENPEVVVARTKYLEKIQQYRQNGGKIFYLVESRLDNDLKRKQNSKKNTGSSKIMLVYAGSGGCFLNQEKILTKITTNAAGNDNQVNGDSFDGWITDSLIPNFPPKSVIIMNHIPHNARRSNMPRNKSKKRIMLDWLHKRNIEACPLMRKEDLYSLIQKHVSDFDVDKIIEKHGHEVLNLPPFMYDLNPIELAWAKAKRVAAEQKENSSAPEQQNIAEMAIAQVRQISEEDLRGLDKQVVVKEDNYLQRDVVTTKETLTPKVKMELEEDSSSSIKSQADKEDDDSDSDVFVKIEWESD